MWPRADHALARHVETLPDGCRRRGAVWIDTADLHLLDEFHAADALQQAIDLRNMQIAPKRPAAPLRPTNIWVEIVVQVGHGALPYIFDQLLVGRVAHTQLGAHHDAEVGRLADI